MSGLLVIISAPSGTGKTTVCKKLLETNNGFEFSVSCTTRSPRPGEVNGREYYFLTRDEFEKKVKRGEFAEWEKIFHNYYGTLKSALEKAIRDGKILLLDVDVKGGLNIRKFYPENSVSIFLLPPSEEELDRRLRSRGTDNEDSLRMRKKRAHQELKLGEQYDYKIVNDRLDETVNKVLEIIEEVKKNGSRHY